MYTASSVTEKDIHDAFRKKWKDFEDCVRYMTGKNSMVDYVVTGNKKDYEDDLLPVLTLEECIKMIDNIKK